MLLSSYRRKETRYYELILLWQFETQLTMAWESTGHIILFGHNCHFIPLWSTLTDIFSRKEFATLGRKRMMLKRQGKLIHACGRSLSKVRQTAWGPRCFWAKLKKCSHPVFCEGLVKKKQQFRSLFTHLTFSTTQVFVNVSKRKVKDPQNWTWSLGVGYPQSCGYRSKPTPLIKVQFLSIPCLTACVIAHISLIT